MVEPLRLLGLLLKSEMTVLNVKESLFAKPYTEHETIVDSARLILLKQGGFHYFVESNRFKIDAPAIVFVPPWTRRSWQAVTRKKCLLSWFEFIPSAFEPTMHEILIRREASWTLEEQSFRRMHKSWTGERLTPQTPANALLLQGEAKACLARFFVGKGDLQTGRQEPQKLNTKWIAEITNVRLWMEQNFTRPEAIHEVKQQITHNDATFRQVFRSYSGFTPTGYIQALRMRYARYLLCETVRSVKEVASAVGFNDPLYFSKQYSAFWGYPPKNEWGHRKREATKGH